MADEANFLHDTPRPLLVALFVFCLLISLAGLSLAVLVVARGGYPIGRVLFFLFFGWLAWSLLSAVRSYPKD